MYYIQQAHEIAFIEEMPEIEEEESVMNSEREEQQEDKPAVVDTPSATEYNQDIEPDEVVTIGTGENMTIVHPDGETEVDSPAGVTITKPMAPQIYNPFLSNWFVWYYLFFWNHPVQKTFIPAATSTNPII